MEKVYDIYVNGELYAQNISMDEEDATAEATAEAWDCLDYGEEIRQLASDIRDGKASIEFREV